MQLSLSPGTASLADLERLYRDGGAFSITPDALTDVETGAAILARHVKGTEAVYGLNTGFGKLASVRIDSDHLDDLQKNLVRSHAAGFGRPLPAATVRLIVALKCLSLGRGASGVRPVIIEQLQNMIAAGVIPMIPEKGSVGASGDLAPLAHMSAVLIGEGEAFYKGTRMPGGKALQMAGLEPVTLQAKEGLALLNGTQASTALALGGLFDAWHLAVTSLTTAALSIDAAMGSSAPLTHEIHALRGHRGQIECAERLRTLLEGSQIRESHLQGDERVQDPYCLRCTPQVIGACLDQMRHAGTTLQIEANAATDNPLVLQDGQVVSGGNFHAEPVALVADLIAIALSEIGCISQRRVALLVDPGLSFGLPAFLTPEPGLNSGLMIAEVTSAALMSENKALANPRSVDSTPTSANQEDHVSMACHGARRLHEMNENLAAILAIEAMTAAQGAEMRSPLKTSTLLQDAIAKIREVSPPVTDDRIVNTDIEKLAELVAGDSALRDIAGTAKIELGS